MNKDDEGSDDEGEELFSIDALQRAKKGPRINVDKSYI